MIGYKGFKSDWTCQGFQYRPGQTHLMDADQLKMHLVGFHFCRWPSDVLHYYDDQEDVYAQVRVEGDIVEKYDTCVTNQLTIINVLTKNELLLLMPSMIERDNG